MRITLKRVYEPALPADAPRILVERLWPRGLTKEAAAIDHWPKDIAPSPELRKWFGHVPERWDEFQARYRSELVANSSAVSALTDYIGTQSVTFVFAAKDESRNSALALRNYLQSIPG